VGLRFAQIDAHDTFAITNNVACHGDARTNPCLMSIDSAYSGTQFSPNQGACVIALY
jgi:hypothetical protein